HSGHADRRGPSSATEHRVRHTCVGDLGTLLDLLAGNAGGGASGLTTPSTTWRQPKRTVCGSATERGSLSVKRVPSPTVLSTVRSPPIPCARPRLIARPSPMPASGP